MLDSLFGIVVIVGLIVVVTRQHRRLGALEREIRALRELVRTGLLPGRPAGALPPEAQEVPAGMAPQGSVAPAAPASTLVPEPSADAVAAGIEAEPAEAMPGPWGRALVPEAAGAQASDAASAAPPPLLVPEREKPDIETTLGTRWAVWVGGLALALGGIFLIRYSIEAGFFGPAARLTLATIFGLVLIGGGEFIRRTGFRVPVEGGANAYIPAILTAAGAFTLFGVCYAAHGIYGFVGPALAFLLMGAVGVATIAAALAHGQALAGLGLLGALATPALIASQAPNAWTLFGYLAVVLVAAVAVARLREWGLLAGAAFAGTGVWTLLYIANAPVAETAVVIFICVVTLLAVAFVWLGGRGSDAAGEGAVDWPSAPPAFFIALSAMALFVNPAFAGSGPVVGAGLVAAMLGLAVYRPAAVTFLHAAGAAAAVVYVRHALGVAISLVFPGGAVSVDGLPATAVGPPEGGLGAALVLLFVGVGFWRAERLVASAPLRAAAWAGWGAAVPLVVIAVLWLVAGNLDRDPVRALTALALAVVFVAGGEWIAREESPPRAGGLAVSFALSGAAIAAVLAIHMAFGSGMTTVLAGALAALPALATRRRSYPVLGWVCVGLVVVVVARVAYDPTIVGAEALQTTPVLNWLLPGYGVPALAFGFAAWQLARTSGGRPRLVMEAAAALFALLAVAMLVRHAMNGGVIDISAPTLAEQSIYTLLSLGAGAILVALDMRSPSSVLRYGSLAMGVLSAIFIVVQHFVVLNPLFTGEPTGRIPVVNLLLLAYLLPAIAAGALALYVRDKRPRWYGAMLAGLAALLGFAYATLSVRRLFKGEDIALWRGLGQWETYSYSALWLAMGVGMLVVGVALRSQPLRIASAGLVAIAVAKVFLFDMSELEGVLRALSFIGLGAVLIGIGLFYQRLLTRTARAPR